MRERSTDLLPTPCAIGTGLLALDVTVNVGSNEAPRCYAGGTCGNVLTILSYLGWAAAPVSRLAPGKAADRLVADLTEWRVSTEFISLDSGGSTPVIIQRIKRSKSGEPYHTFSWRCPVCGTHLPGYKSILATLAQSLSVRLPSAQVFFFDRVSRGVLHLAEASARRGAVVVFEPSGIGDPNLFREAWALAHIVKYSHERLKDLSDLQLKRSDADRVLLEVETQGAGGLRYRSRLPKAKTEGWRQLRPFTPPALKDASGSGDWCTAGILHRLANGGLQGFRATDASNLDSALRYGQALAAWNCGFEGARGGMYQVGRLKFRRQVDRILEGEEVGPSVAEVEPGPAATLLGRFCPSCKGTETGPVRDAHIV